MSMRLRESLLRSLHLLTVNWRSLVPPLPPLLPTNTAIAAATAARAATQAASDAMMRLLLEVRCARAQFVVRGQNEASREVHVTRLRSSVRLNICMHL